MKISGKKPALAITLLTFLAKGGVQNNAQIQKTPIIEPSVQLQKISRQMQAAQFTLGVSLVLISGLIIDPAKYSSSTEELIRLATGLPLFGIGCELATQSLLANRFATPKDYAWGAAGNTAFGTLGILFTKFYISRK
ncbi:MAG TPA: hypothetical protein VHO47_04045 [Candidatus Babeliales bacterium]|nr:hypothetical protein [Candidatus Babeliales bacterium]